MIWQRPAAAKKIPNATVPQPKFVNLKLLNCYNNAAIKNHLPLILDTSTTTSNSLSISALVMRSWRGSSCTIQVTQGKFAAGPLSIRKVGSINACWVFDRGTWIHPANLVMTSIFLAKFCHFLQRWSKYNVSKTTWSTTSIFASVSSFLTGHWPHLLMFLNVLDGFFHRFEPGLGEPSPALKDVENRLNVNRGFPERPVTPHHSNTPNLSKG